MYMSIGVPVKIQQINYQEMKYRYQSNGTTVRAMTNIMHSVQTINNNNMAKHIINN